MSTRAFEAFTLVKSTTSPAEFTDQRERVKKVPSVKTIRRHHFYRCRLGVINRAVCVCIQQNVGFFAVDVRFSRSPGRDECEKGDTRDGRDERKRVGWGRRHQRGAETCRRRRFDDFLGDRTVRVDCLQEFDGILFVRRRRRWRTRRKRRRRWWRWRTRRRRRRWRTRTRRRRRWFNFHFKYVRGTRT